MPTANQRLGDWKKSSASKAKQAIDAIREAKKLALRTCKLADDLFGGIDESGRRIAREIERDTDEEDDSHERDVEIVEDLNDFSSGVSEYTEDARTQLESVFDGLIEGLEQAAESIREV